MFVDGDQPLKRVMASIAAICALSLLVGVSGAVTAAEAKYQCRTVPLQKHFSTYGWQKFRTRFCFDRGARRVIHGGVNVTWTEPNRLGKLLEFKVSDERKDQFSFMRGRGLGIYNISTVEACTLAACAHRVTSFKVRAYWDGGYQWRVGDSSGTVSGPP